MPIDLTTATNEELLNIIKDPHDEQWQGALDELDGLMDVAKVKKKRGFDTPPPPPIP